MKAISLALGASPTWGVSDFFGPLAARTLGALRVLVSVQLGGLAGIALVVAIRGKGPAEAAALLAIPAAVSGTLGLYIYYRGMAVGAMSIVAPIAGLSAAVPVAVGIASGDRPSAWKLVGIACALGGVFLASRDPGRDRSKLAAGVGLALLAAWARRRLPLHARRRRGRLLVGLPDLPARIVLKERVARSQEAGIALTLAGVALISAG